jgi:hypothetical protein
MSAARAAPDSRERFLAMVGPAGACPEVSARGLSGWHEATVWPFARALANAPDVLLWTKPFGRARRPDARGHAGGAAARSGSRSGKTIVFVTHSHQRIALPRRRHRGHDGPSRPDQGDRAPSISPAPASAGARSSSAITRAVERLVKEEVFTGRPRLSAALTGVCHARSPHP